MRALKRLCRCWSSFCQDRLREHDPAASNLEAKPFLVGGQGYNRYQALWRKPQNTAHAERLLAARRHRAYRGNGRLPASPRGRRREKLGLRLGAVQVAESPLSRVQEDVGSAG